MSVTTFFEKIMGLQEQRKERQHNSYRSIVDAIAKEDDSNPTEVEAILNSVGKSVDDLRRDVEKHKRRMELKAQVAAMPQVERELSQIEQQIKAADKLLEEAESKHDQTTNPLFARQRELLDARNEATRANSELYDTCEDPWLETQYNEVLEHLNQLILKNQDLESEASYRDSEASNRRIRASNEVSESDRNHRLEQAAAAEKQAKALRQLVKENQKTAADLIKRRDELEQQMREW